MHVGDELIDDVIGRPHRLLGYCKKKPATLANGCFWCSEAIFKRLKGVKSVLPGYSGGIVRNPSYTQVCTGRTGHAGSIQIEFDPKIIPYEKILDIFWYTHDPIIRFRL